MKQFSNFESKRTSNGRETLPVGGYVCQIQGARVEDYGNGFQRLILAIDVVEGEYAGIWKRDFDNNTNEDRKWRGIFRLSIPTDDGSEQDSWRKRAFGNAMWAVEQSNPGFVWDWDERKLKGKKIGIIYRNEEWKMNGRTGWTTKAGGADSIDNIRSGNFRMLKDKPLKDRPAAAETAGPAGDSGVEDANDLPF